MSSQSLQIREAVVAALEAAVPGVTVFESRNVPFTIDDLPSLAVYTLQESYTKATEAPREYRVDMDLIIEAWVDPGENVEDAIDVLTVQVWNAMHADPFFGGVASDSLATDREVDLQSSGDRILGYFALSYRFTYFLDAPSAPDDLDDFLTAGAAHNLGNEVHEDNQAVDVFTVQESP